MKWKLTVALLLSTFALVFVLAKAFGHDPHEVPFMLQGKRAPSFHLKRMDTGEPVTLEQLKGRPFVLNFWASWCGPCEAEQPVLDWAAQALGDQVQLLGVVFEDTEENARAYFRGPTRYPQLWDPRSQVAVDFAVAGVPETYFIDADGVIRSKWAGPIDPQTFQDRVGALGQPMPKEARP
jgi:cytochrome c biogenesis protein CcmG/thiol:disulfide interchange protein DsbE